MSEDTLGRKQQAVSCLHCGEPIFLPTDSSTLTNETRDDSAARSLGARASYVVLWCQACHKEAPYLSREFVEIDAFPAEPKPRPSPVLVERNHGLVMRRGQSA